ncbi:FmdE family protein [Treponema phagedenis]|uniref:FmdE family protein n=1 Tax=Treponema phagedenis TaxID=162 RepID=UPI0001F6424E|nr:FmdE family protein [Treponema phagedenis]EFW39203.1 tungsten formylmethanofuran dehydrogenase, subunit E, FwdE [Treponema phagedenis F0421]TYT78822.1 formylmethanofuran dehydrogenase [Treponema phagedenis]
MDKKLLWERCVQFHGHKCGGLTIGYKATLYAIDLLDLKFSSDEQVVCICENDACEVDSIQVILGCSIGKGNLLFHMTGKQAFSFYNRTNKKSVRLMLKKRPESITREKSLEYYQSLEPQEMFDVMAAKIELPETARMFDSYVCDCCVETAGANRIHLQGEKKLCIDCFKKYNRFDV